MDEEASTREIRYTASLDFSLARDNQLITSLFRFSKLLVEFRSGDNGA